MFIVIPAYNEETSIVKVLKKLKSAGYKNLVLVDDGSEDKTQALAKKEGVYALKHKINRGQGAALKTGIDFALLKGADIIITFDADGQHRVEDLKKMVEPLENGTADIVLGSRFLGKAENIPASRKFLLKVGIFVLWILYGLKLTDSQNGLRALSRTAAEKIEIKSDRMEHAGEIIGEIKTRKLRCVEVPITILYTDYSKEHSAQSGAFELGLKMLWRKFIK